MIDLLRRVLPMPVKNALRPLYGGGIAGVRALIQGIHALLSAIFGRASVLRAVNFVNDSIDPALTVAGIRFDARGWRAMERAATLLTKEPDTISWLNEYVRDGDVLYDVGANIGVYSLYAAKRRGARVIAFEPMALNYAILNTNIFRNGLDDRIAAFNIALHDCNAVAALDIAMMIGGKAGNQFGRGLDERPADTVFRHGVIGLTLAGFVRDFGQPFPNHIKIDVDGNEPLVVAGMKDLLGDARLKTIAVELNLETHEDHADVIETIKAAGFRLLDEPRYVNLQYAPSSATRNRFFVRSDSAPP